MPLFIECTNEEKVPVFCAPSTASGKPAPLDGVLTARAISGTATSEPASDDPKKVWLISSDEPGDTTFVIEADADLGEGVVLIQDTVTLTVTGAMASSLGISAGPPELK